jgi:hypothetical protein
VLARKPGLLGIGALKRRDNALVEVKPGLRGSPASFAGDLMQEFGRQAKEAGRRR